MRRSTRAIFAFAFGKGVPGTFSRTNVALGFLVHAIHSGSDCKKIEPEESTINDFLYPYHSCTPCAPCTEREDLLLFAQSEIDDMLQKYYAKNKVSFYRAEPRIANRYLNTVSVVRQFCEEIKKKNLQIDKVILVAHPYHFHRCQRLLHAQGFNCIENPYSSIDISWEAFGCDKWGFDKHSTQLWTTNKNLYMIWEFFNDPICITCFVILVTVTYIYFWNCDM